MRFLCLFLGLSLALAPVQADPGPRLRAWVARVRGTPGAVDAKREGELRAILGELRLVRAAAGETAAADLLLLEVAALGGADAPELAPSARLARTELEDELARPGTTLALALAQSALAPAAKRPRAERALAAELLGKVRAPATLAVLTSAAREDDRDVALAAARSLSGWPAAAVHGFFLEELARGAPLTRIAGEHFQATAASLDEDAREALERETGRRYLSEDWRAAAAARGLVRALDVPRAVPILIEALATWNRRAEAGRGSKRVRSEIVDELRRLSGRSIGPEPERWSEWWEAVRAGRVALPSEVTAAGGETTSAAFFGLRAVTDRVLFVVDRSGSMRTPFGTSGRSRHDEAIEQLLRFLRQSGPDTRFSVALFSKRGHAWRTRLQSASEGNLELAESWLRDHAPDGDTRLFEGLRAGLGLNARGRVELERLEADTVIVLCDGATAEGPGWVARWLAEENERAQLVFHCVQIGRQGNGTLEALARGSGGQFVQVQG